MTYSKVFKNIDLIISPVETQNITKENWYKSENGLRTVMGELERCGKYFCNSIY